MRYRVTAMNGEDAFPQPECEDDEDVVEAPTAEEAAGLAKVGGHNRLHVQPEDGEDGEAVEIPRIR